MICKCGATVFLANQVVVHRVAVNSDGIVMCDMNECNAEPPYGPFECANCGTKHNNIGNNNE